MDLLLTGCFKYSETQLDRLHNLGYTIHFMQQESGELPAPAEIFDAIVCNGLFLTHDIKDFTNLKLIQLTSAGLDRVPVDYITEAGIHIYNARGVYSIPMAEWALTKVLDIYKQSASFFTNQRLKKWEKNRTLKEVNGKNVAIIGAGSVGSEVSKRFKALGAVTTGFDLFPSENGNFDNVYHIKELSSCIANYDIIVVTVPLTDETMGMFDYKLLSHLRQDAIITNISRGKVFVEYDLIRILKERNDIIAVLDVFESEPLDANSELWGLPNAVLSPHNSFVSDGNNDRMFETIYKNLKNFAK